jgi:dienelactone hydrolase
VTDGARTWSAAGILRVPYASGAEPLPAIVIVHGSGGVDSRGEHYAAALNRAGVVTLEIDLWAPRHVRSAAERPRNVSETLPDAFAALSFLSEQPQEVDSARIGIMGFSWGGVVSMLSATQANRDRYATGAQAFAAHAPLYPVCWVYNRAPGYEFTELTGAPVFIQAGTADTYDRPDRCLKLQQSLPAAAQSLVNVRMHGGATHAWERREPDATINDPFSHEGQGGPVDLRFSEHTTRASTEAVVAFFENALGGASPAP